MSKRGRGTAFRAFAGTRRSWSGGKLDGNVKTRLSFCRSETVPLTLGVTSVGYRHLLRGHSYVWWKRRCVVQHWRISPALGMQGMGWAWSRSLLVRFHRGRLREVSVGL